MLSKFLFLVTVFNLALGMHIELPRDDLIILESGEQVEGHIQIISDSVINIKTNHGEKTIIREVNIYSPRDIVETGVLKNKRHAGHVQYFGDEKLEIKTTSGLQTIDRALVRKIIISHESALPPLDL